MGGEFGREWIHVYAWLSPFVVHMQLLQHFNWLYFNTYIYFNKFKSLKSEKKNILKK